jgi:hypothetical protein
VALVGCVAPVDGWAVGEVRSLPAAEADRLCAAHPEALIILRRGESLTAHPPPPVLTR